MFTKIYESIKKFFKNNYKFLIFLTFLVFMMYYELPYIIYKRGGTIDLANRVQIDTKYEEEGTLSMSYVTALKGTPAFVLLSFIIPDWDLYPMSEVAGEDEDYNEVLEVGKVYLNEGIDNAIISAFTLSDYDITITKEKNIVTFLSKEAKTDIKIGDEIIKINDEDYTSLEEFRNYINTLKENDKVELEVLNDGKTYQRYAYIYKDVDELLKVGVAVKTTYEYKTEIPVTVKMKDNESGSSGGLMMSLAIYNALTKEDITKGLNIVGTGSINSDGTVEEIGGVKYKVLAAERKNADIFFCPKENYKEAMDVKEKRDLKVKIIQVGTLKDAIDYLNSLEEK